MLVRIYLASGSRQDFISTLTCSQTAKPHRIECAHVFFYSPRFSTKTFAEQEITPFCSEKQVTDSLQRTGKLEPLRLKALHEGAKAYRDPFDERLNEIKKQNAVLTRQKEERWKKTLYQQAIKGIPVVAYNPNTALQLMKSGEAGKLFSVAAGKGSSAPYCHPLPDQKHPVEAGLDAAMKAAKAGDREALFNYFMNQEKYSQGDDKAKLIAQRVAEAEARLAAEAVEDADGGDENIQETGYGEGAYDYRGDYGDDEGYVDVDRESELPGSYEDQYGDVHVGDGDHAHEGGEDDTHHSDDYATGDAGDTGDGGEVDHSASHPYDDNYNYGGDDSLTYEYSVAEHEHADVADHRENPHDVSDNPQEVAQGYVHDNEGEGYESAAAEHVEGDHHDNLHGYAHGDEGAGYDYSTAEHVDGNDHDNTHGYAYGEEGYTEGAHQDDAHGYGYAYGDEGAGYEYASAEHVDGAGYDNYGYEGADHQDDAHGYAYGDEGGGYDYAAGEYVDGHQQDDAQGCAYAEEGEGNYDNSYYLSEPSRADGSMVAAEGDEEEESA